MRAADRPLPPITLHDDPQLSRLVMRPVVAIGGLRKVAEWDDPDNVWDVDLIMAGASARVGTARVGHARVGRD